MGPGSPRGRGIRVGLQILSTRVRGGPDRSLPRAPGSPLGARPARSASTRTSVFRARGVSAGSPQCRVRTVPDPRPEPGAHVHATDSGLALALAGLDLSADAAGRRSRSGGQANDRSRDRADTGSLTQRGSRTGLDPGGPHPAGSASTQSDPDRALRGLTGQLSVSCPRCGRPDRATCGELPSAGRAHGPPVRKSPQVGVLRRREEWASAAGRMALRMGFVSACTGLAGQLFVSCPVVPGRTGQLAETCPRPAAPAVRTAPPVRKSPQVGVLRRRDGPTFGELREWASAAGRMALRMGFVSACAGPGNLRRVALGRPTPAAPPWWVSGPGPWRSGRGARWPLRRGGCGAARCVPRWRRRPGRPR